MVMYASYRRDRLRAGFMRTRILRGGLDDGGLTVFFLGWWNLDGGVGKVSGCRLWRFILCLRLYIR